MAKKQKKERRVASVDAMGILTRDLKGTALWVAISVGAVAVLMAVLKLVSS